MGTGCGTGSKSLEVWVLGGCETVPSFSMAESVQYVLAEVERTEFGFDAEACKEAEKELRTFYELPERPWVSLAPPSATEQILVTCSSGE